MASDGLSNMAKTGKCRMCQRTRNVEKYLKAVGEVRHGFAKGYIWECRDQKECDYTIDYKLEIEVGPHVRLIKLNRRIGRFKEYVVRN